MRQVTLIGSHGYRGSYGGWDQLVENLVSYKGKSYKLNIINPKENNTQLDHPNVKIIQSKLSGFGFQGLLLDFCSLISNCYKSDTFLILGAKSAPLAVILKIFFKKRIIINVGGIEWLRPEYNSIVRAYLKFCFFVSVRFASKTIFDNEYYINFIKTENKDVKKSILENIEIISYGAIIDKSKSSDDLLHKFPFLRDDYYLSVSRSIQDNKIFELCTTFKSIENKKLVLVSNLSKTEYGKKILEEFSQYRNIIIIDGLYKKNELDLIRRNCNAYIHTHTLCGSAPSLIEMIAVGKPIISIDVPQNKFTLHEECQYFEDFGELSKLLKMQAYKSPSEQLKSIYKWPKIVSRYEAVMGVKSL